MSADLPLWLEMIQAKGYPGVTGVVGIISRTTRNEEGVTYEVLVRCKNRNDYEQGTHEITAWSERVEFGPNRAGGSVFVTTALRQEREVRRIDDMVWPKHRDPA